MRAYLRSLLQYFSVHTEFKGRVRLVRFLAARLEPSQHPTRCRMPNQAWMLLDLRDPMHADMYYGLYESHVQQLITRLLKPGMVFMDLGAHVGFYTIAAAQRVGPNGAVHAFEALAANAALLEASVAANHFSNAHVQRVAISDHVGSVTLHVPMTRAHNASGFATLMNYFPDAISETVPCAALDGYIEANHISHVDFIKMDIEAAEVLALRGMTKLLQRPDKPRLLSEVNSIRLRDAGYAPTILFQMLGEYGYTPFRVEPQVLVQTDAADESRGVQEILFLPTSDPLLNPNARVIPFARLT